MVASTGRVSCLALALLIAVQTPCSCGLQISAVPPRARTVPSLACARVSLREPLAPQLQARSVHPHMRFNGPPGLGSGGIDWRSLAPPVIIGFLFASGAVWWLFQGFFLLLLVPIVIGPIVQWYLSNNLVEGTCPDCASPVQGLKGQRTQCLACGAALSGELSDNGVFLREGAAATDTGVVDIDVMVD
eukprot:CAMPEP_0115852528 /NCGR_PEP_ID=MMETSP0287-20121206/13044_1 /TAXON_ID=412157 /ORGANISM="Chrysochromulina rotalis, Strain UIO044" /LENGTH=187 /DNA_ID=CAMNT_0003306595 /DNA_START=9 /DNA_END=572 /DNA_ORIENTATION=+